MNELHPIYVMFEKVENVHSHNTRGSKMSYVLPEIKMQGKKTCIYNVVKIVLIKHVKYLFRLIEKSENSQVVHYISDIDVAYIDNLFL